MSTADGHVIATVKIVDNGPAELRWNVVVLGDGYREADLPSFALNAQAISEKLLATPPFDQLRSGINVYRVDVASTDSGADDPKTCGGPGIAARTYFDASFCHGGLERALQVDVGTALQVAGQSVPQYAMVMVMVNTATYGGTGGQVAVFSLAPQADEIALHEMGHTAFGLADEYELWAGCGVDTDHDRHQALEPVYPNVTTNASATTIKWRNLLTTQQIPTTRNADCTKCDPQPTPVPHGTVGAFEGAHYYHCGAFRPEFNCRMRQLGQPYCAVCRQRIIDTLEPHLPPRPPDRPKPQPTRPSRLGCLPTFLLVPILQLQRPSRKLLNLPRS